MKKIEEIELPIPLKVFIVAIIFLVVFFYTNRLYEEENLFGIFFLSIVFTLSVIIMGALVSLPILLVVGFIQFYLPKSWKFLKDFRQLIKDRKRT